MKNEQTDAKGNIQTQIASTGLFPTFGRVNLVYTSVILVNQIIISFLIPFKLTFLEYSEEWAYVYYDTFLDFLFLIDILVRFNMPIYLEGRLITDRKVIAKTYVRSWFVWDLLALLPFSYLRKNSEHWVRGKNE